MKSISSIFDFARRGTVSVQNIKHPDVHLVSKEMNKLFLSLGECVNDDFWSDPVRRLKKLRFELSAAPLSQEYFNKRIESIIGKLTALQILCDLVYPDSAVHLDSIIKILGLLKESNLTLLQSQLLDYLNEAPKMETAVLVKDTHFIQEAETEFSELLSHCMYNFISQDTLRGDQVYMRLAVVGPFHWYEDFVFSAPRAQEIRVFKYSFIRSSWKYETPFAASVSYKRPARKEIIEEEEAEAIDANVLLIKPEIDAVLQSALAELKNSSMEELYTEAYLYLLEDNWAVFLETEGATVLTIDTDDSAHFYGITRLRPTELEKGMFVLLRTEGGGDYVRPIADQILGASAKNLRLAQRQWKSYLHEEVAERGFNKSLDNLFDMGCYIVSPMNLRNWLSEDNISTQNFTHFKILFQFFGRESEAPVYWEKMMKIRNAHQQAGQKIRKILLDKVKNSDLNKLIKEGIMEFNLDGEDSGSITALRLVDYMRDSKLKVAPWRIGFPFKGDETSWH